MHGRVRLTEVRCTRIRLAPFCIRLSKKPCGGTLFEESVDNLETQSYRVERERKRVCLRNVCIFRGERYRES